MKVSDLMLIGNGAQADVYFYDGKAVKIFKPEYREANARYEADIQDKVFKTGLPVPEIYGVEKIDGRTAIVMEYIQGKTVGELVLEDMQNLQMYLGMTVDAHLLIHNIEEKTMPDQKDALRNNILQTYRLEDTKKEELLRSLETLEDGDKIYHGDFHPMNLIQTDDGVKIIDWICAGKGSPCADVCRSYLLLALHRKDIAGAYVELYCKKSGFSKQEVMQWLPVMAGARLNENAGIEDTAILRSMVKGAYTG